MKSQINIIQGILIMDIKWLKYIEYYLATILISIKRTDISEIFIEDTDGCEVHRTGYYVVLTMTI